jgi:hypothetical protein
LAILNQYQAYSPDTHQESTLILGDLNIQDERIQRTLREKQ